MIEFAVINSIVNIIGNSIVLIQSSVEITNDKNKLIERNVFVYFIIFNVFKEELSMNIVLPEGIAAKVKETGYVGMKK